MELANAESQQDMQDDDADYYRQEVGEEPEKGIIYSHFCVLGMPKNFFFFVILFITKYFILVLFNQKKIGDTVLKCRDVSFVDFILKSNVACPHSPLRHFLLIWLLFFTPSS